MITNTGKNILAKYLIGQAPSYASHIAIGCGAQPLAVDGVWGDYSDKTELDFEMFRIPVVSRGYVTEDGISKIVLTGELPTQERYEISEVGVYSAGYNPSAGAQDSRVTHSFSQTENWEYKVGSQSSEIPVVSSPLDVSNSEGVIDQIAKVFHTNADNKVFSANERIARSERCRFLNSMVMLRGDVSAIDMTDPSDPIDPTSDCIILKGTALDLTKNSPSDELRIAFSVINKNRASTDYPASVKVLVEFSNSAGTASAKMAIDILNGSGSGQHDFQNGSRYIVANKKISDLQIINSNEFSWSDVSTIKIFAVAGALSGGHTVPSDSFYIALDALRLENKTSINPLYGLTGYSVIKNTGALPIVKVSNTSNLIEFRFAMDVL